MNLVFLHDLLYFRDFCFWTNSFRLYSHDVADGSVEELCLPFLHSATNITICDNTHNTIVLFCNAKPQFPFADKDNGFAKMHFRRKDGQVVFSHHILRGSQQALSKFATRMKMSKVFWKEMAFLHECYGQSIAHSQCGCG